MTKSGVTPSVNRSYPFVFDITTETTSVITDFPNNDPDGGEALAVSSDGIVSYSTYEPQSNGAIVINFISEGFVYDVKTGTSIKTKDFIKQEYGISVSLENTYIYRYCPDNNAIYGTTRQQTPLGFSFPGWMIRW